MEEQKPKFGKPGKSLGLTGMSEAGGQPTNISVKTNTLLYYIKSLNKYILSLIFIIYIKYIHV